MESFSDTRNLVTVTQGQQWTRKYHLQSSSQPGVYVEGVKGAGQGQTAAGVSVYLMRSIKMTSPKYVHPQE